MKTVYVVGVDYAVLKMFGQAGWAVKMGTPPPIELIDLVCFTGGSDVSPYLYGEENTSSYCDPIRDEFEVEVFEEFKDHKKVGICRGGQFLNVMSGGKMIQHIDGHSMGYHKIDFVPDLPEGEILEVHGDHHQAMIEGEGAEVLYIALPWSDATREVIWYPETKSLCFQPHPEWGHDETKDLFFELLKEYLEV